MQHRTHVPKFGNWQANANTPAYTAVFEVARAEKGGKMMNPNDPAENPALAAALGYSPPDDDQPPTPLGRREDPNATEEPSHQHHEQRSSQEEEVDLRQQTEQPGRYSYEPPSRRPPGEVPPNRPHGDNARYAGRGGAAGGPARAVPSEPLHRRGVVDQDSNHNSDRSNGERSSTDGSSGRSAHRGGGRGGGPPAWDPRRRVPSGDDISTPGTPSKSRLSAGIGRPEELPARGGALPKFGAWDAKDPNAGDGFTMMFQKASVEKKEGGPVRIPQMGNELLPGSLEDPHQNQSSGQSKRPSQSRRGNAWICCFGGSAE
ncbi:unnamed protein product [Sphagnum compactum]